LKIATQQKSKFEELADSLKKEIEEVLKAKKDAEAKL